MILGSRNYFVDALKKDVQKKKYKQYMLTFDGEYSKKPIYLYFVIYKDKKTGNFTVNETIKKFLEDINLTITGYYNGTGNDITAIYEKNPKNIVNDDSIAAKEWDDLLNGELNTRYNSFTGTIQKAK